MRLEMKKSILSLTILFLLAFFPMRSFAQYSVDLQLFEGLAELQIGSIVSANGIVNTQQYLSVIVNGANGHEAQLENSVYWQKDLDSPNKFVASALTKPFPVTSNSMRITNLDIGTIIQLEESDYNDDVLDELRKLGKLAGLISVEVRLIVDGVPVDPTSRDEIGLLNPANTLDIISPPISSFWNEGNIPAQWNAITGASEYLVRCNTKLPGQDNEEGLKSGEPLLWDVSVGNSVSINLWDLFSGGRVPTPGTELALQVIAVVKSTSVDTKIESPIINFNINDPETQASPGETQQFVESMRTYVINSNLSEQEQENLISFLNLVESGQVSYNGVRDESGNVIPAREVQRILRYLQDNPDMIVFVRKR
jgi:hypothetical protein